MIEIANKKKKEYRVYYLVNIDGITENRSISFPSDNKQSARKYFKRRYGHTILNIIPEN